jgi:hypothetical protein
MFDGETFGATVRQRSTSNTAGAAPEGSSRRQTVEVVIAGAPRRRHVLSYLVALVRQSRKDPLAARANRPANTLAMVDLGAARVTPAEADPPA